MSADDRLPDAPLLVGVPTPLRVRYRVWWLCFALCGLAASFFEDALWEPGVIIGFFGVGCVAVLLSHFPASPDEVELPRWQVRLVVGILGGLILGAILLAVSMASWFTAEVLTAGRTGAAMMWFVRFVSALFYGAIVLLMARRPQRRGWNIARLVVLYLLGAGVIVAVVLSFIYTGPADPSLYPPRSESPYRLPWKPGIARLCGQSNRGVISHRDWEQYAYDFTMPVGAEVCAARGGVVFHVVDHHDGNGLTAPANEVIIRHDDGTFALYLHGRKDGARVKKGQRVNQGDVICESGNVGYSTSPHLHFAVARIEDKRWITLPVTFADVPGDGIPRAWRRYTSGS